MSAAELLVYLRAAGFVVMGTGDRLQVRPASRLTDALRAAIRDQRDALVALVSEEMKLCAICWRRVPEAKVEEQGGIGTWWRCLDREGCAAETWRWTRVERQVHRWLSGVAGASPAPGDG